MCSSKGIQTGNRTKFSCSGPNQRERWCQQDQGRSIPTSQAFLAMKATGSLPADLKDQQKHRNSIPENEMPLWGRKHPGGVTHVVSPRWLAGPDLAIPGGLSLRSPGQPCHPYQNNIDPFDAVKCSTSQDFALLFCGGFSNRNSSLVYSHELSR